MPDLKRINKFDMLDSWHYHYTWRPPKGEKSCCVLRIRCVNLSLLIVRHIIDKEMDSRIWKDHIAEKVATQESRLARFISPNSLTAPILKPPNVTSNEWL